MDIFYKEPLKKNSYTVLRQAGYIPIRDRESGKESYVLKIQGERYPRFHLYVKEEGEDYLKWHLHLDHKKHGWSESRHDTDYDGEKVKEEAARLRRWLEHFKAIDQTPPKEDNKNDDKSVGGFIAKLFG